MSPEPFIRPSHNVLELDPAGPSADSHVVSRRLLLGGIVSTALTAAVGCTMGSGAGSGAGSGGLPLPTGGLNDDFSGLQGDPLTPQALTAAIPYTATASAVLSEDHFLTANVVLQEGEYTVPFSRPDGTTEALVRKDSSNDLYHLRRDPTSSSGWSMVQVLGYSGVKQICVGLNNADKSVHALIAVPGLLGVTMTHHLVLGADGTWSDLGASTTLSYQDYQLSSVFDLDRQQLFFLGFNGNRVVWATPGGPDHGLLSAAIELSTAVTSMSYTVRTGTGTPNLTAYGVIGGHLASITGVLQAETTALTVTTLDVQADKLWAVGIMSGSGDDFAVYELVGVNGLDGAGLFIRINSGAAPVFISGISFDIFFAPVTADGLLHFYGISQGTLYGATMSSKYLPGDNEFQVPRLVPMQVGVNHIGVNPTDRDQTTMLPIAADDTLHMLVKDATTGLWTDTPVQLASEVVVDITQWRVEVTVTDNNGAPAIDYPLTVTADQVIGIWQPSGNSIIGPNTPAIYNTNFRGQATIATPCVALSTALLTVTGANLTQQLVIDPAADVHAYLAGQAPLDTMPVLTGDTLRAATIDGTPTGVKVAPLLSATGVDSSISDQVATAINHTMTVGTTGSGQPLPNGVVAFALSMAGAQTSYQTSRNPGAFRPPQTPRGSAPGGIRQDLSNTWRGVQTGAIELSKLSGQFDAKLKQWTLTLETKIKGAIQDAINAVVRDVKDALHAINGILNAIGAKLDNAVNWLRRHILALLADVAADAAALNTILLTVPTKLTDSLSLSQRLTNQFFTNQTAAVAKWIDDLKIVVGTKATFANIGSPAALTMSKRRQLARLRPGSANRAPAADNGYDASSLTNSGHGNWLLNKLESYVKSEFPSPQDVSSVLGPVTTAVAKVEGQLAAAVSTFSNSIKSELTNPHDFVSLTVNVFLDALKVFVTTVLTLVDDIITALLGLLKQLVESAITVLNKQLDDVPLLSSLLKSANVSTPLTVGQLVCMLMMFPVTAAYKIAKHDWSARVFAGWSSQSGRAPRGNLPTASSSALAQASGGITIVWTVFDVAFDVVAAANNQTMNKRTEIPWFLLLMDFAAPATLLGLGWPDDVTNISQGFSGTLRQQMEMIAWLSGAVTALCALAGVLDKNEYLTRATALGVMINSIGGMLALFSGAIAGHEAGDQAALGEAIAGNIPLVLSSFITDAAMDASGGLSAVIKLGADVACGAATSALILEHADG